MRLVMTDGRELRLTGPYNHGDSRIHEVRTVIEANIAKRLAF